MVKYYKMRGYLSSGVSRKGGNQFSVFFSQRRGGAKDAKYLFESFFLPYNTLNYPRYLKVKEKTSDENSASLRLCENSFQDIA